MDSWKRVLIFSSLGAGVALFVSGRRASGAALAGVGLGGLLYENRETLARVARDLPPFLEKSSQVIQTVVSVGQGVMAARRSATTA
jgi:hypothetical protein